MGPLSGSTASSVSVSCSGTSSILIGPSIFVCFMQVYKENHFHYNIICRYEIFFCRVNFSPVLLGTFESSICLIF